MFSSRQLLIASALDVRLKSDILTFVLSRKRLKSVKWIKSYFILKMEINKEKIRYILQYHYDKDKNAAQVCEKICAIYGEDTLSKSTARKWFVRFHAGNFDVKDEPRSGRLITEKSDEMVKIERDKHVSTVEIARELNIDHKTVLNHLLKAGYKKKLDVWVPHELSVKNMMEPN